jgi:sugar lactone lactonase YvrE
LASRITTITPRRAIEGARVSIEGSGFDIDGPALPDVRMSGVAARIVYGSSTRLDVIVPSGLEAGPAAIAIDGTPASTSAVLHIAAPFATGLHQVDNPVFDAAGNLYVTFSGTRGQQVPVSIFRVTPAGTREPFSSGIVNPTSMAIDAEGRLYVSSRFEGTVYRVAADGSAEPFATDLGVACGLAFGVDDTLFVGDRSGTIFTVDRQAKAATFASLPASVAAFHLAYGGDGALYVTAPTLSTYDPLYRIDRSGGVNVAYTRFGRPQGLAFAPDGTLYVIDALAGASGLYRMTTSGAAELALAGPGLVGVAFDGSGVAVVTTNDTAYRLPAM